MGTRVTRPSNIEHSICGIRDIRGQPVQSVAGSLFCNSSGKSKKVQECLPGKHSAAEDLIEIVNESTDESLSKSEKSAGNGYHSHFGVRTACYKGIVK